MTENSVEETRQISVAEAEDFARRVLTEVGARAEDAAITAENLVFADRSGIASHGLLRLPLYAEAAAAGGINTSPQMSWIRQSPGGGLLDADGAFGQVAMQEAVRFSVEELGRTACTVVSVQNSVHFGAGAFWVDKLAEHGYIGMASSTTGPAVAAFGGSGKVLGTNPLSIGMPTADGHSMTVDMATSTGAYGKVIAARNSNTALPEGWAVDSQGASTTDPQKALDGALTAFGGHKGSGLSIALEGLSAALSQASYAYETVDIWVDPRSRMNVGHTLFAINPEFFGGVEHTRDRFTQLRDRVRTSGEKVFAPGDLEARNRDKYSAYIDLSPSTAELLRSAAARWKVAAPTLS
ncbi:Ldh family oxidoreductase [Nesterenkonia salmonea]|uniref:Ldh family oxidoreductase n=1 Tax=Nesterenkonia salmonea TaxID=1804987 RepID=A0A5R9BLP3_9MICC|nr:Ldh family oxidoreductase [Nesterenkonia salmonea]TLQ01070.1 Ldh family oxidoreductase [Nesterenkonia salmonea]